VSDVDDWEAFRRGRWRWHGYGYEDALAGCGIGDLDGHLERNRHHLFLECKEGVAYRPLPNGQGTALRRLAELPRSSVWLLIGRAQDDDPRILVELGVTPAGDVIHDWARLGLTLEARRRELRSFLEEWWRNADALAGVGR
jgi:hypothetical protein